MTDFMGRPQVSDFSAEAPRPWTVAELTRKVRGTLEGAYPRVWVEGALSRPVVAASGHLYFGLQDDASRVDGVMWAASARRLRLRPVEGALVRVRGLATVYAPAGRFQLVVDEMEPAGEGARELRLRELRAKLLQEGLFAPERKRPLPFLPRCIALVTSPSGAAVRDLFKVIFRRFPAARVVLVPVRVQGEGAAEEIAEGLRRASAFAPVDVVIVGRGGGAVEDLWSFNEEVVARAVFASRAPVVSAVGHEIDTTLADDAADLRAATPSEAGERVVPVKADLVARLEGDAARLRGAVVRAGRAARRALDGVATRPSFAAFGRRIEDERQRLDECDAALRAALLRRGAELRGRAAVAGRLLESRRPAVSVARLRERADAAGKRLITAVLPSFAAARATAVGAGRALAALDPTSVLRRGFTLTWIEGADGARRLVRSAADADAGASIKTAFAAGDDLASVVVGAAPRDRD